MVCLRCDERNEVGHAFCIRCGAPLSSEDASLPPENESFPTESAEAFPATSPISDAPSAPYPWFVVLFLISTILSSGSAFLIAYSLPFEEPRELGMAILFAAVSVVVAAFCWRMWSQITTLESEQNIEFSDRHHSVLKVAAVMVLVAWLIASGMGHFVGTSGVAEEKLRAHAHRSRELNESISEQRSIPESIPEAVQTLESLQPEAEELLRTLSLLKEDWNEYRRRFPNDVEVPKRRQAEIDVLLQQTALLLQEIEVAKEIEPLRPKQQEALWQEKMIPLTNQEDEAGKNFKPTTSNTATNDED